MDGLAIISSLLFVPPVAVRVSEGTFLWRRVDVAAVLWRMLADVNMAKMGGSYLAWVYDFWVDSGSEAGCEAEGAVD